MLDVNKFLCPQHAAIPYLIVEDFPGMARHAQGLASYFKENYDLHSSRIDQFGDCKPYADLRACWLSLLGLDAHVRVTALQDLAHRTYDENWVARYSKNPASVLSFLDKKEDLLRKSGELK